MSTSGELTIPSTFTMHRISHHNSFVRSVSMDTWQADQIKRMQVGSFSMCQVHSLYSLVISSAGMLLLDNSLSRIHPKIKADITKV